jgi:hypothetical protein
MFIQCQIELSFLCFSEQRHIVCLDLRTIPRNADGSLQLEIRKQNCYLSALCTFTCGHLHHCNKAFRTDTASTVRLQVYLNVKFKSKIVRLMVQDSRKARLTNRDLISITILLFIQYIIQYSSKVYYP